MKVFIGAMLLALAGCADLRGATTADVSQKEVPLMGSAMFVDGTGSYFLGGFGLPESFFETLPPGTVDLSDVPESEWPI